MPIKCAIVMCFLVFAGSMAHAEGPIGTLTFLDDGGPVHWETVPFPPGNLCGAPNPEYCGVYSPGVIGGFPSDVNDFFNIYDPDGVTLSDTLQITSSPDSPNVYFTFQSQGGGVPLVAIPGGTPIIETGSIQVAATFPLGAPNAGFDYVVQFISADDASPVPEPRSIELFILGLVAVALGLKGKKIIQDNGRGTSTPRT
jgi:hypothetical protein